MSLSSLFSSSVSSSESLINLFKGGQTADELLKSTEIIKKMIIGISYLDNKNPNSLARRIFGDIFSHASIFFSMGKKTQKLGFLFNMENMNMLKIIKIFLMLKQKKLDMYMEKKQD